MDALSSHVQEQDDATAFTFLEADDRRHSVTYQELDERARCIASGMLQYAKPGDRALMMYPAGLDFIEAFLGCLYAGIVAVPAYPPKKNRNADRIMAISNDCAPSLLLCTSKTRRNVQNEFSRIEKCPMIIATDELHGTAGAALPTKLRPNQLAFLQYTSGSTAAPKGVMVSHENIVANERLIEQYFDFTRSSIMVSWLPMFHDMGLIGGILAPLFVGFPSILMAPNAFLREPVQWLQAITEYGGTCTGAPNFAYDLCVRKVTADQKKKLDLSSLTIAYNGAEPVRASTLDGFSKEFFGCGFDSNAFFPCYGMAETTLLVSGGPPLTAKNNISLNSAELEQNRIVEDEAGREIVSCGQVGPNQEVRIVNVNNLLECQPDEVGEIWVCGESVAKGYWNRSLETTESFQANLQGSKQNWFRTGDIGFLRDGELYVTGRRKDLIIIRGRNLYPQDVEQLVEQHLSFVEANSCAAFSVEANGQEQLVVVAEGTREMVRWNKADTTLQSEPASINRSIEKLRAAIVDQFGTLLLKITFVRPTSFPRTSSGKVQRQLTKRMLINQGLDIVFESSRLHESQSEPTTDTSDELIATICGAIRNWAAKENRTLPPLGGETTFASLGVDSMESMDLTFYIEQSLGLEVEIPTIVSSHTIRAFISQIDTGDKISCASNSNSVAGAGSSAANEILDDIPPNVPSTELRKILREHSIDCIRATGDLLMQHCRRQEKLGFGLNNCVIKESSNPIGGVENGGFESESIIWCVNHYTGLNRHPIVIDAAKRALDRFGTGSGTSAVSGGRSVLHVELETRLSAVVGKPSVTLFPTGYTANVGAISAIAGPDDLILFDRESHASIIDGIKMSSAKSISFKHNSVSDLRQKLIEFTNQFTNVFVITESVYSMSGDVAPLREIAKLKSDYSFIWYVDEAHAFGLYGKCGAGLCERDGVTDEVDLIMSTLSKATATVGGFVASKLDFAVLIRNYARSYLFQACTPPSDVAATLASLELLSSDTMIADELHQKNSYMRKSLEERGFNLRTSESPIIPVYISDDSVVESISKELMSNGVFSVPVFFPAVERGHSRLRFIVTRNHSFEQIDRTIEVLDRVIPVELRALHDLQLDN